MKRNTPLITLLTGAVLGVILLIASMLATPSEERRATYRAPATSSPGLPAAVAPRPSVRAPPSASSHVTGRGRGQPPRPAPTTPARCKDGAAAVAVAVHGSKAIAYVCNGSTVEGWMRGKVENGKLTLTGKNNAHLTASYHAGKVSGDVEAHGTSYSFSVSSATKSSGLYEATVSVQGKTIKAGWIVLGDGTQIGSLETDADSAENAVTAPKLDLATMTARLGNLVLHAVPVSGVTGSGF